MKKKISLFMAVVLLSMSMPIMSMASVTDFQTKTMEDSAVPIESKNVLVWDSQYLFTQYEYEYDSTQTNFSEEKESYEYTILSGAENVKIEPYYKHQNTLLDGEVIERYTLYSIRFLKSGITQIEVYEKNNPENKQIYEFIISDTVNETYCVGDTAPLDVSGSHTVTVLDGEENIEINSRENIEINSRENISFLKAGTARIEVVKESEPSKRIYQYTIREVEGEPYVEYLVPERIKIGYEVGRYNNVRSFSALYKYHNFNHMASGGYNVSNLTEEAFNNLFFEGTNYGGDNFPDYENRIYYDCGHVGYATKPGIFPIAAQRDEDNPYNVIIEEPVINTNLPQQIKIGSQVQMRTTLDNTALENMKVPETICVESGSPFPCIVYEPRMEIISGEELVERSNGDYSNTLSTSEDLKFIGEGTVVFKVTYEMLSEERLYPNGHHPNVIFKEEAMYSPEATFTVNVVNELPEEPVLSEKLKFTSASLTLQDSLTINYKVSKSLFEEAGYTDPYVKFVLNGNETLVKDYSVVEDKYIFDFTDIAPNQMNDTIYATLYAKRNGVQYSSETKEYSVAEYCYNILNKYQTDEYAKLRTLIVDLLNYGAESQIYTTYRTDSLVNTLLTTEQAAWGTSNSPEFKTVQDTAYKVIESPTVTWKGAGLNLQDSITMRFKIAADQIDGLTVKVVSESGEWMIDASDFEKTSGGYYIFFDGFNAGQMSESVFLTVYSGNTAVSNTIRYSIESYAFAKQNSADEKMNNLLIAMMKYGNSAYSYTH